MQATGTIENRKDRIIMKRALSLFITILLLFTAGCVHAEAAEFNPGWLLPETIEMTEEITGLFDRAMEGLVGVSYEPLGFLGEKEGVYCILCRATVVYPDATPYYALVYITENGVQNIWEIWMDAHATRKD